MSLLRAEGSLGFSKMEGSAGKSEGTIISSLGGMSSGIPGCTILTSVASRREKRFDITNY